MGSCLLGVLNSEQGGIEAIHRLAVVDEPPEPTPTVVVPEVPAEGG
eukprot:CAMPEP_0185263000 /NCGR_PEP_ID=MMETSP1359-20130426/11006_1 /TAXON_ID=552665 /ORGANISM="Bigelowiella longifila, Strain CCMP242" /LENGTH=45 /DNA_ID= /DNA_START= /DNA_END= /DNA_ORIENTATION=